MNNEGGYPIPDNIAIWLLRLRLIQILACRVGADKLYYFNNTGFHFITKGE